MVELTDGHVTLRKPTDADVEGIVEAARASLLELMRWMPWAHEDYGPDDTREWMQLEGERHEFVIVVAGTICGICGLNDLDGLNKRANLGYWVRTDRTGEGIATVATKLLATHGLDDLGFRRLEVIMSIENEPSRRVAERAGATYEGVLRNRLLLDGRSHNAHSFAFVSDPPTSAPSAAP